MNNKMKNEILIEGYLYDRDLDNKSFQVKNNEDIIEFRFNDDFRIDLIEELQGNEIIRVKGSFDQDEEGIFLMVRDILVLPNFTQGEE